MPGCWAEPPVRVPEALFPPLLPPTGKGTRLPGSKAEGAGSGLHALQGGLLPSRSARQKLRGPAPCKPGRADRMLMGRLAPPQQGTPWKRPECRGATEVLLRSHVVDAAEGGLDASLLPGLAQAPKRRVKMKEKKGCCRGWRQGGQVTGQPRLTVAPELSEEEAASRAAPRGSPGNSGRCARSALQPLKLGWELRLRRAATCQRSHSKAGSWGRGCAECRPGKLVVSSIIRWRTGSWEPALGCSAPHAGAGAAAGEPGGRECPQRDWGAEGALGAETGGGVSPGLTAPPRVCRGAQVSAGDASSFYVGALKRGRGAQFPCWIIFLLRL